MWLQHLIEQRTTRLSLLGWKVFDLPSAKDMMHQVSLFSALSDKDFNQFVVPHATHKVFQTGDVLFSKGDSPNSFFIILRGSTRRCGWAQGTLWLGPRQCSGWC